MSVTIEMPKNIEEALQSEWGDLSIAAKEALAIESYRSAKISLGFLAEMLGMGTIEAQQWLGKRGVHLNYASDDLDADRKTLSKLFDVQLQ